MARPAVALPEPGRIGRNGEREHAPGLEHPRHLGKRAAVVFDMLEHLAEDRGVEGPVGERKLGHVCPGHLAGHSLREHVDRGGRVVDARHLEA